MTTEPTITDRVYEQIANMLERGLTPKYVLLGRHEFERLYVECMPEEMQGLEDMLAGKPKKPKKLDLAAMSAQAATAKTKADVVKTTLMLNYPVVMSEFFEGVQVLPDPVVHFTMLPPPQKFTVGPMRKL